MNYATQQEVHHSEANMYEDGSMNVRTPDPYPGWLNEEDLHEARQRLPMLYVEAIPVRLDPLGYVNEVGLLLTGDESGQMLRTFVSGRVMYRENDSCGIDPPH